MTNWRNVPFHTLFHRLQKRTGFPDEELLSVYRDYGVIRKSDRDDNFNRPGDLSDYQLVERGDLVLNKMKTWQGSLGISPHRGIVSPAYFVYKPVSQNDERFLHYALRCRDAIDYYASHSTGIRVNQWDLSPEWLDVMPVALPDLETQRRIADYLDKEISEMDSLIDNLEALAENLKTRKVLLTERLISQDDQGNKYPTLPVGLLFRNISSGTTPKGDEWYTESENDGIPWVTTSELRETDITESKKYVTEEAIEKVPGLRIHPAGSIMIAMYGATIGRFGRLEVPASCNQACCVLSNPYKIDPDFFYFSLWAKRDELILLGSGGGQPNISQDVIKRFEMPVPPLEDQKKIAERLQAENTHMDKLIHDATTLAALLRERKTALTTEVVTGRKEV